MGGGGFSGAEFAPFPSPCLLPPAGMGRLFSGVSQSLCFSNRRQCVRPVNFSLLSHSLKKLPPTALRAFGPVPTLSNAAHSSPFSPHLLVAGAGVWSTFVLGVAFRHVICGFYYLSPQLGCPPRFENFPRTASVRVSWCLETSSIKTPFPGRVSIPSSFVSLFIFYILSYLLSKTTGCFSGHLMSSASDQKLFCEVCSAFNCSFHEFVGEKVVSRSYSSAILAPPPVFDFL